MKHAMMDFQSDWTSARDELVRAVRESGFSPELGELMAKQLGSPKAIERMTSYIRQAMPETEEIMVDEMLSICQEIEAWRAKKASQEAQARFQELTY